MSISVTGANKRYGDFAGGPKRPEDRLVLVATA